MPGVLSACAFRQDGERVFWDVHDPAEVIVIELADEHFKRLVMEVDDPEAAVTAITGRGRIRWRARGSSRGSAMAIFLIRNELAKRQQRRRAAAAAGDEQRFSPDGAMAARQAGPKTPGPMEASAPGAGGAHMPARSEREHTAGGLRQDARAAARVREPTPHDRRALYGILLVLAILIASLALSISSGKDIYILGYVSAIVYAVRGPRRHNRPWAELGLKRGSRRT